MGHPSSSSVSVGKLLATQTLHQTLLSGQKQLGSGQFSACRLCSPLNLSAPRGLQMASTS